MEERRKDLKEKVQEFEAKRQIFLEKLEKFNNAHITSEVLLLSQESNLLKLPAQHAYEQDLLNQQQ